MFPIYFNGLFLVLLKEFRNEGGYMLEYIFAIIGVIGTLEFIYWLLWELIDELFKLKGTHLVKLGFAKFLIIKHTTRNVYKDKTYKDWDVNNINFNKSHVSLITLIFQIIIHFFCLYIVIASIFIGLKSLELNSAYFLNLIIYPSLSLAIINFVVFIIAESKVDTEIQKKFSK